jgi:uncharacterized protein (DUF2249 family)
MTTVVVATSPADARAVEAVKNHHLQLAGGLALRVEVLLEAAALGDQVAGGAASEALVRWCDAELIPHALAEEKALYPLAHQDPRSRLLVDALLAEHHGLIELVAAIQAADSPVRAAANAQALRSLFGSHLLKENEQMLPLLAESPEISLALVLAGMQELLGGTDHVEGAEAVDEGGCGGECGCGHQDGVGVLPELDARAVPHAIRHATIFGALDSVGSGSGMVLVAPHDPVPLLAQLEQRSPGRFSVEYLERGPKKWRVRFTRA